MPTLSYEFYARATKVHVAGGWEEEIGNLAKCKAFFARNPLRLQVWRKHADCLVELKIDNPNLRIRSADQLGPKIQISADVSLQSSLEAPQTFFVTTTKLDVMGLEPTEEESVHSRTMGTEELEGVHLG